MKQSTSTIQILIWLFAIGLAALVISRLPLADIGSSLLQLSLTNWIVWIFINVIIIVLLTARWKSLTKAIGLSTNFFGLLRVRQAGQLINFVTPGPQLGAEPLQVYWLWKRYYMSAHAALLTVGLDRFYEFWVNFAVLLLAVLVLFSSTTIALIDWRVVAAMLVSLMVLEFWLLLEFISVPIDVATFIFLFVIVRLAFLLPFPGGIGTVEAALFWAFQSLTLPLSAAAALITLMRLRDLVILVTGAVVLPGLQRPNPKNEAARS